MAGNQNNLFDRLPPQDLDAERGVLGSVMLANDVYDDVAGIIRSETFYLEPHQRIWAAIAGLRSESKPCDPVTISDVLQSQRKLDDIGGHRYLGQILDMVPHPGHAKYYAEIVREKWQRRTAIYAMSEGLRGAYEGQDWTEDRAKLQRAINRLCDDGTLPTGSLQEAVNEILDRLSGKPAESVREVFCGFSAIHRITGHWTGGSLIILAARPSVGKTALALNVTRRIAEHSPVLFVSLEQSISEIAERLLSTETQMPTKRLGELATGNEEAQDSLLAAAGRVNRLRLDVSAQPRQTIDDIQSTARRCMRQRGGELSLIVVDYLGLITPTDARAFRESQIAQMSRELKGLARSLNVPVLCLAQLNREVEKREDGRPRLADLRDSGAIEQDADIVLMPWRPDRDNKSRVLINVAKNRNGETGEVTLECDPETYTFSDVKVVEDSFDLPDGAVGW